MFGDSQRTAQWVVFVIYHKIIWASLVAQLVENPPAGDLGSIPGLGRCPGGGKGIGYPFQYSGLENSMDSSTAHGVAESDTTERLSFHNII